MNLCRKCGVEKPNSEFHKDGNRKSGVRVYCKSCVKNYYQESGRKSRRSERGKEYYLENKERHNSITKTWRDNNPEKMRSYTMKYMASKKNQTPDMNRAELVEIESMYLYNQVMPGKWHVDHIKPIAEGGMHHPSNLQILSEHDNCSKGDRWV